MTNVHLRVMIFAQPGNLFLLAFSWPQTMGVSEQCRIKIMCDGWEGMAPKAACTCTKAAQAEVNGKPLTAVNSVLDDQR